jgi:hypothetical protein
MERGTGPASPGRAASPGPGSGSGSGGFVSRKPIVNEFNQQTLPKLQPKLSLYEFIAVYYVFGMLFLFLGGMVYFDSSQVSDMLHFGRRGY